MRILSLIESFGHGGAETVLTDLVLGLGEHEHRVVHFGTANGVPVHRPFVRALESGGVRVYDVHWSSVQDATDREALLGAFLPDVVLAHWWGHDPWRPWMDETARPGGGPAFVCVLHRAALPALPGYDRYVLVSPTQAPQVAAIDPMRVRVIANGVDVRRFREARRPPSADFVIGRVSNLGAGKIPEDWVATALAWDLPGARFVVAGDGSQRQRLHADAVRLGVADRFSFPGHVPREDVPSLLASFDIFCYVSADVECHPLAILEAMAAGLPIVAEAKGGIGQMVEHGVDGLLAADLAGVGDALRRLVVDADLRRRLGRAARATAIERFGLARQADAYRRLLADVAGSRGPLSLGVAS